LDSYLAAAGVDSIQPDHAAQTDMEQNGLTDLEHAFSNTLVRQTASGFVFEPLPAPTGKENPLCRPAPSAFNKPRLLARLRGDGGHADLVARTSSSFVVWYGVGNGLFTPQGVALPFKANGVTLSNLASYQFSFGDFNNDGLEDVILTAGQSVSLYVNQGIEFD